MDEVCVSEAMGEVCVGAGGEAGGEAMGEVCVGAGGVPASPDLCTVLLSQK